MEELQAFYKDRKEKFDKDGAPDDWPDYLGWIQTAPAAQQVPCLMKDDTWKPRTGVLEVCSRDEWAHMPVKVRVPGGSRNAWVGLWRLDLRDLHGLHPKPMSKAKSVDLSCLKPGMDVQALRYDDVWYAAEVLQVSTCKSFSHAPVKIRYNHQTKHLEEWVGVEALRSRGLAKAKKALLLEALGELSAAKTVQCLADDEVWYSAEVLSVSSSRPNPVKVRQLGYPEGDDEWVPLDHIRSKVLKGYAIKP